MYLTPFPHFPEMNPVRAAMVERPEHYRWSSYCTNAGLMANPIITPHPLYLSLAHDIQQRYQAYKILFTSRLEPETHEHINTSSKTSIPLGNDRFREAVERELGRKVNTARKGRPPKSP